MPSFVLLPLSPSVGAAEVGKIVGVFCKFLRAGGWVGMVGWWDGGLMRTVVGFVVATAATVYIVRGLQMVLPKARRARDEDEDDGGIQLAEMPESQTALLPSSTVSMPPAPQPTAETQRLRGVGPLCTRLPERLIHGRHVPSRTPSPAPALGVATPPRSPPPSRAQRMAAVGTTYFDEITYGALFLGSLPVLYSTGYVMPAHLSLTTLFFLLARRVPPQYQRMLHPVLTCAALTILGVYLLSASTHTPFKHALKTYKTPSTYLSLFRSTPSLAPPGAGNIFAALLDVSIVALALPMYSHRSALLSHLPLIVLPTLLLSVGSLTLYPLLCSTLGIAPARALAFSARSLTLALAQPAVANLGGDTQFLAVLCITSGIFGVLVGPRILRLLGVGEGEYVVRGVALGANGSAVATAWLLQRGEPRAAAMGSLAMVALGVAVVVACAVGSVRDGIAGLAGV